MSELLSLSGVCFNAGGRQILNDVSLSVAAGEVVSLIGPNGAGKSTLLGVIAGDIVPSSGEILLDGTPLDSIPCPSDGASACDAVAEVECGVFRTRCMRWFRWAAPRGRVRSALKRMTPWLLR